MGGRGVVRRNRSIYRVHYALPVAPPGPPRPLRAMEPCLQRYNDQVAGHQDVSSEKYIGILKCNNGTILKPVIKGQQREIEFYEAMAKTTHPELLELTRYITKYHGHKVFRYNNYENDYLILNDIADGMVEPCIMDVKIGRRTWDPLASEEKIRAQDSKYVACRRDVAFCVPGFQVYDVQSGQLRRFDKDFGKKLDGTTVREALRIFLNAQKQPICRSLVLQFLTELWRIQRWAVRQTVIRLYASSILLVYDAHRLRECCGSSDPLRLHKSKCCSPTPLSAMRMASNLPQSTSPHSGSFSGQLSDEGPVYRKISSTPTTPIKQERDYFHPQPVTAWQEDLKQLRRSHSFTHNYDSDVCRTKQTYRALLDQLSSDSMSPKPWVSVKIIDFVHAFFHDEAQGDDNFAEGVNNLVAIFEEFLRETDSV